MGIELKGKYEIYYWLYVFKTSKNGYLDNGIDYSKLIELTMEFLQYYNEFLEIDRTYTPILNVMK